MFPSGRRSCIVVGLTVLAMGLRPASADDATRPATAPSAEVAGLITNLGSDSFTVRQNAQEKLSAMGEAVEPQLTAALGKPMSEEARTRLKAVIDRIEQAKPLAPSVITMHYTNALAIDILRDFQTQAKADMGADDPALVTFLADKHVSVSLDHADFWQALRAVSDTTGARIGRGQDMRFNRTGIPFDWIGPAGAHSGLCFIGPVSCQQVLVLNYGGQGKNTNTFQLRIYAGIEPKLHALAVTTDGWLKECIDEKGHALASPGGGAPNIGSPISPIQPFTILTANLNVVPDIGQKIATLKGEIHCKAPLKSEVIDFDDPAKAVGLTRIVNGLTIRFTDFSVSTSNVWQLGINITGNLGDDGRTIASMMTSELEVIDDQGRVFHATPFTSEDDGTNLTMMVQFVMAGMPPGGGPRRGAAPPTLRKFHWMLPTEIGDMAIPFELHDLELPAVN